MPAARTSEPNDANDRLLAFNRHLIDQALALVAAHPSSGRRSYAGPVGSHLRHVIEHYEALLFPALPGIVDYDRRARDREVERHPERARERLLALRAGLGAGSAASLAAEVQVLGQAGTAGEFHFSVASSIGRELAFVASHAVHHFALLAPHCRAQGIATPADFGQAPSTVAHRLATAPLVSHAE